MWNPWSTGICAACDLGDRLADTFAANREHLGVALSALIERLGEYREALSSTPADGGGDRLEELLGEGEASARVLSGEREPEPVSGASE